MPFIIAMTRAVGTWYDSLDLTRMSESNYRAMQVNRLVKRVTALVDTHLGRG